MKNLLLLITGFIMGNDDTRKAVIDGTKKLYHTIDNEINKHNKVIDIKKEEGTENDRQDERSNP